MHTHQQQKSKGYTGLVLSASLALLANSACSGQPLESAAGVVSPTAPLPAEANSGSSHGDRRPNSLGTVGTVADGEDVASLQSALGLGSQNAGGTNIANGVTLDVLRSLIVNDPAILSSFSFQSVLDQIVASSGTPGLTSLSLFQQLWRTQLGGVDTPSDPRCTTTFNGFDEQQCPRFSDGQQSMENPFGTDDSSFLPIALINRVDLIPTDGGDCGEYRVIFARRSGVLSDIIRSFMIFEAVLPNPRLDLGLEGCRPVQSFWRDLSTLTVAAERARRLHDFYFDGLPGYRPVFNVLNYGDSPFSSGGRVRVNTFRSTPWQLKEFKLNCTTLNPCNLLAQPSSVKETPNGTLFDTTLAPVPGSQRDRFQQNLVSNVASLAINDANRFHWTTAPDEFNDGESDPQGSQDSSPDDYEAQFTGGSNPTFANRIQAELTRLGLAPLTPLHIVRRAMSQTCAGCHNVSSAADLGGGVTFPTSGTFVHVSERLDGTGRFGLSSALTGTFLPHRASTLASFLNTSNALKAAKVTTAPVIDGNLNEPSWNLSGSVGKLVAGASNNDALWSVTWSNSALFVGVRVYDSNVINDSGANFWDDDSVEVYIDGNHERSTSYDANDRQYTKRFNDTAINEKAGRITGVQSAWALINGGYSIELSIPWTTIGVTPSVGKQIGFDVAVNDDDNGGTRDGQLVGTGTANDFQNTSAFGTVQLDGSAAPTALSARLISPRDAPVIDGKLTEWVWSPQNEPQKRTLGSLTNRVRSAVVWDDTHLIIGATVKDSSLRNDSTNSWDDDSIEIYLDGQHNRSSTYDANDLQFVKGFGDSTLFEKNGRTSGVLHAVSAIPGGYSIEIAVPWALLGFTTTPPAGTLIGFDIAVNDDQNGGARDGQSVWFGTSNNATTTAGFGDLTLGN